MPEIMWNYSNQDWVNEIKKSLKQEALSEFRKKISGDISIDPFSLQIAETPFQSVSDRGATFLAIQNYQELEAAGLHEWMRDTDVAFRFRQLDDLIQARQSFSTAREFFLSQPFAFKMSEEQSRFLNDWTTAGHSLNMGWSPLSFGLARGEILKKPFYGWEHIFSDKNLYSKNIKWFYLSSAPYQWAGAEPHIELGVLLSLACTLVRQLMYVQVPLNVAAEKITFGLSLGTDVLVESSKVVAMKNLWLRTCELLTADVHDVDMYTLPSLRVFSGRDPWNNVMRLTLMSLASMIGGARGFKCVPYDALNKEKSPDSVRISTNIPLILKKEGFLGQVENVLDGAPLFARTVDQLCQNAWTVFQEIESKGGVFEAVRSGWLQAELKNSAERSAHEINSFHKDIVGVNKYVHFSAASDAPVSIVKLSEIIDPLFLQKADDEYLIVEPLHVHSLSYNWEVLQLASDAFLKINGQRPKVLVIKGGGPIVEKKMAWLESALHLAGLQPEIIAAEALPDLKNIPKLAILNSSSDERDDELYMDLKAKGVDRVWSMSHPREEASVNAFISQQANVLDLMKEAHHILLESV